MLQQQGAAGPLLRSELVLEQAQGYLGSNSWCVSYPTLCPGGLSSMVGKDPSESYSDCCSDFLERVWLLDSCPGIRSSRSATGCLETLFSRTGRSFRKCHCYCSGLGRGHYGNVLCVLSNLISALWDEPASCFTKAAGEGWVKRMSLWSQCKLSLVVQLALCQPSLPTHLVICNLTSEFVSLAWWTFKKPVVLCFGGARL